MAARHLAALAESELRLARAEVAQGAKDVTTGLALSLVAAVLLALAGVTLSAALIAWLVAEQDFSLWVAATWVGGAQLVLGVTLIVVARRWVHLDRLVPKRSLRSLKRDFDSLKEFVHD